MARRHKVATVWSEQRERPVWAKKAKTRSPKPVGIAQKQTEPHRMVGWHKAMLYIDAQAFPSSHFVLRRDRMPPLLSSGFGYLYISTPGMKPWSLLPFAALQGFRGSAAPPPA